MIDIIFALASEEELTTVNAAQIPLDLLPQFSDKTTSKPLSAEADSFSLPDPDRGR